MRNIMRIMIDTNIIVSAMLFRNGSISALLKEIVLQYEICICTFAIEELKLVINRKFPNRIDEIDDFLNELSYELIYTPQKISFIDMPYVRDEKDYPILAAAMSADVDVLLSGDKDLLVVEIDRPEILDSKEFREKYL